MLATIQNDGEGVRIRGLTAVAKLGFTPGTAVLLLTAVKSLRATIRNYALRNSRLAISGGLYLLRNCWPPNQSLWWGLVPSLMHELRITNYELFGHSGQYLWTLFKLQPTPVVPNNASTRCRIAKRLNRRSLQRRRSMIATGMVRLGQTRTL